MKLLIFSMALAPLFSIGYAMAPHGSTIEWLATMAAVTILAFAITGATVWQRQRRDRLDSTRRTPETGELEAAPGPIARTSDSATRLGSARGTESQRQRLGLGLGLERSMWRGQGRLCDQAPVIDGASGFRLPRWLWRRGEPRP